MLKKEFETRMKKLLGKNYPFFLKTIKKKPRKFIRVNTIKISPDKLKKRLKRKWQINQPLQNHPEIIEVKNIKPGQLGNAREHLLGLYFIQDISSMFSIITLDPKPDQLFLDLTAAPGSKTTHACSLMKNTGQIIANDKSKNRLKILEINLQRCGCTNVITTNHDGNKLCKKLSNLNMFFDKILIDPQCSEEANIKEKGKQWNKNKIKKFSKQQKKLASSSIKLLKPKGELVYSTCTYSVEENEAVISYLLNNFNLKIEKINLPIKKSPGIKKWEGKKLNKRVEKAVRIYPHQNKTKGFFIAKIKK